MERGKNIFVFDEPKKNTASAVAAGLFNPIIGKLMKQAWMADQLFPYLFQFYERAEKLLGHHFFHPQTIYRPFISVEEQNEWMGRSEEPEIKKFIEQIFTSSSFADVVNDRLGGVLTKQSGYLDTNLFMRAVCDFLKGKHIYREIFFDSSKLKIAPDSVSYEDIEAVSIIFCDGLNANNNPFFDWIPIRPLKGETLTVLLDRKLEAIFNRGVYIVPNNRDNTYKVGATYTPGDTTEETSAKARKELEEKLSELIKNPFEVHHQHWGMRPTTPDRRPVLGAHPAYKNVLIFNGLGTKGVSLAPYFSNLLALWLEGATEIAIEVNIERFKALYSKFSFA